ncbi:MAG: hypothetical protein KAX05_12395, partial [Bacteroidales bacterium]|nr:hypothetical protein [Bacteroidales bacterium]
NWKPVRARLKLLKLGLNNMKSVRASQRLVKLVSRRLIRFLLGPPVFVQDFILASKYKPR